MRTPAQNYYNSGKRAGEAVLSGNAVGNMLKDGTEEKP